MPIQFLDLPTGELRKNPWNTNYVDPTNQRRLKAAVERFGFFKPIIVREHEGGYQILGGAHRWEIAVELGMETVPCANLGVIDDVRAKEIGLADNARYGDDDATQLSELLAELGGADVQEFLPYSDDDIASLYETSIALEELDAPEDEPETEADAEDLPAKAPKTHTMIRFKVPVGDAERISDVIAKVQRRQGFDMADDLTNAGDALVFLLLTAGAAHGED